MDSGKSCRSIREEWMAAFDEGRPQAPAVAAHVAACEGCRAFAHACEAAQIGLLDSPVPPPDPLADAALLAALRAVPQPGPGVLARLLTWVLPGGGRGTLYLAGAGAASFAVTLLLAGALSVSPAAAPNDAVSVATEGSSPEAARQVAATPAELDAWLDSARLTPMPPIRRPRREPREEPKPAPARRSRRPVFLAVA